VHDPTTGRKIRSTSSKTAKATDAKEESRKPQKMTYGKLLGSVMAQARTLKGIKQKEVAQKMGIAQSGLSKLEKGLCAIKVQQFIQYCNLIGEDYLILLQRAENLKTSFEP
jgi:ribosome-binding protein aMBF1 (putative translation factor)